MNIDNVLTRYEDSGHLARKSLCQELHEADCAVPTTRPSWLMTRG